LNSKKDIVCLLDDSQEFYAVACNVKKDIKVTSINEWYELCNTLNSCNEYFFGYFSYDIKNLFENLSSRNVDFIKAPLAHFKSFENLKIVRGGQTIIEIGDTNEIKELENELLNSPSGEKFKNQFKSYISKNNYLDSIDVIKNHIQNGNIYEANFCYPFISNSESFNAVDYFKNLRTGNSSPFSAYLDFDEIQVISSSPERFIRKEGNKIISQPIKGTIARSENLIEDELMKAMLKSNQKDRSENVMIVDLVRNDLSRFAKKSSVKTTELCEIYTFPTLHQMISTVECEVDESIGLNDIIASTFPMGSMTGAPKISAMEIIEEEESFSRGIYSGSIGYITPEKDFDFNVVIRSLIRNKNTGNMMIPVGGAITSKSNPEAEYKETLLKAKALLEIFES